MWHLCNSIKYSFLENIENKLSAASALHQATPIIAVSTQMNAQLRWTV